MIVSSRLKKSIAMVAAVTLLTTGATTYAAMTKETTLTVRVNNEVHEISTQAGTVGELLEEIGYKVSERTLLNAPVDAELTDAMNLVVNTKNTVEFSVRGVETELHTEAETVGAFLAEQGYTLEEHDVVFPAEETPIHNGMAVRIDTIQQIENIYEEEIPFETEYVETEDLYEGEDRVAREGQSGLKQIIAQSFRHNTNQLPSSVKEVILQEPVNRIVEVGTKVYVEPATQPAETEAYTETYTEPAAESSYTAGGWMNFTATAYDPTVGDTTRMGTPARVGVVAVDPSVIPLGSIVEIEGYGTYSAEDTGGAINGNRIDIFLSSHSEAINFGVRSVRVRILN